MSDGFIRSCCLHQIPVLPYERLSNNRSSANQPMIFYFLICYCPIVISTFSFSYLAGMTPGLVLHCCCPCDSWFDVLFFQRSSSAYLHYKEWSFEPIWLFRDHHLCTSIIRSSYLNQSNYSDIIFYVPLL